MQGQTSKSYFTSALVKVLSLQATQKPSRKARAKHRPRKMRLILERVRKAKAKIPQPERLKPRERTILRSKGFRFDHEKGEWIHESRR